MANSIELTGKKLIIDALDLLGANDATGEPEAAILDRDQRTLNSMLDAWNTEGLIPYACIAFTAPLVAATSSYTIGAAQTFNTIRPVKIEQGEAFLRVSNLDFELSALDVNQWAELPDRATATGQPTAVYYEAGSSTGTVNFYPTPTNADTFVLYNRLLLSQIDNLNTAFTLPPGYSEAITHHLAIRLAPKQGRPVPAEVVEIATTAKANLKRINMPSLPTVRCAEGLSDYQQGYVDVHAFNRGF